MERDVERDLFHFRDQPSGNTDLKRILHRYHVYIGDGPRNTYGINDVEQTSYGGRGVHIRLQPDPRSRQSVPLQRKNYHVQGAKCATVCTGTRMCRRVTLEDTNIGPYL